jgi:hypothetical protein
VLGFPLGVGLSKSSSMCEMSESAIEGVMLLSPSVASWFPPRTLFPFFCLMVPGMFWLKRKLGWVGGVEDDLACWGWAGVAGGLFLCVGVIIVGPGPWRWSSLIRISGLSTVWRWVDLPRESMVGYFGGVWWFGGW